MGLYLSTSKELITTEVLTDEAIQPLYDFLSKYNIIDKYVVVT